MKMITVPEKEWNELISLRELIFGYVEKSGVTVAGQGENKPPVSATNKHGRITKASAMEYMREQLNKKKNK